MHAAGHAVQAHLAEHRHLFRGAGARVDFNREFPLFGEREDLRDHLHHVRELVVREVGGGAAAEVELLQFHAARDDFLHELGFLADRFDVLGALRMIARHDLVAAAVVADVVAEGNVHVERQIGGFLFVLAARERALVVFDPEARVEAVGRRVGGVSGRRHIKFAQQIHFGQFHAARFGVRHSGVP